MKCSHRVSGHVARMFVVCALWIAAIGAVGPQSAPSSRPPDTHRAMLDRYCVTCHNQRARTAGLALDELDLSRVGEDAAVWEKVVRKLRGGLMPPSGAPRPDPNRSADLFRWLEGELDRWAESHPNPGAPTVHRLNRIEYANAIRDLLAIEFDPTLLPPDDSSHGFDNIAGTLGMSTALLERYLAAADRISRLAVGTGPTVASQKTYSLPVDLTQDHHFEGLPLGTRGGILIRHHFPVDGEYVFHIEILRNYNQQVFGNTRGEQLEVSIDGEPVGVFDLENDLTTGFVEHDPLRLRAEVPAGEHSVAVTFPRKNYAPVQDVLQPFERSTVSLFYERSLVPHVGSVTVDGPYRVSGEVADTESRDRIFVCRPDEAAEEAACAREILENFGERALRRPLTGPDLDVFMDFYRSGREQGTFETGVERALQRILASPEFIYRVEREPSGAEAGEVYAISDLEMASRLSFFLWSSIPDDTLRDLASSGSLREPGVLDSEVERMLADPRSGELVRNFAGQWLYLRNLDNHVPEPEEFPDFDDNLRQAFRTETELLVESVLREDRSVLELLTADYTFLNERLASHYRIGGIRGSHFRRVQLPTDSLRHGLLGHGSVLTVTSYPTRTSPVLRGKWVLENILGITPPEPPPDVPALEEAQSGSSTNGEKVHSVRQRLEAHRSNPTCAACHAMIDPAGFALENFDAVGRFRTEDGGIPVDSSTRLVDGTPIAGPRDLRETLVEKYAEQFVGTLTEKMLVYALGRGLEHTDMPVVRSIVKSAAAEDYRFSSIVRGIVGSAPFQMRMAEGGGAGGE